MRSSRHFWIRAAAFFVLSLAVCTGAVSAQPSTTVTDDEINAVAKDIYCPVCENITLDTCGTQACADWRNEIRLQLEAGMSADEIKTDFVRRFGDRVVGTPHNPVLRALSLVTPFILIALGGYVFFRVTRRSQGQPALHRLDRLASPEQPVGADSADVLRARIERDIEK
jgi:cytochrome c-type biogenesis protein CcmH